MLKLIKWYNCYVIIKHEVRSQTSKATPESPADKTLRLAAAIGKASGEDPLRPLAFDVLGELLWRPNPPVERLRDADFIARLLAIEPDNRTFRRPDSRLYGGAEAVTKEQEVVVSGKLPAQQALSDSERSAAIEASKAEYKKVMESGGSVLPVEVGSPVAAPLDNAEAVAALVRQPSAIGAAAVHDTLHPGSHN